MGNPGVVRWLGGKGNLSPNNLSECFNRSLNFFESLILGRMGEFSLKMISVLAAGVLLSCSNGPVEYAADNSGGYLHQISTHPAEIFRNKVDHEAELEARGVEPPVGNASWHEYWVKMIAYWTERDAFGTHQQVTAYIVQQRRARGLPPL
jgi:hypothetical protein